MKNILILLAFSAVWTAPALSAPGFTSQETEDSRIIAAATRGPAEVDLHGEATLKLPAGTAFLPAKAAATLLARMNNAVRPDLLGLILGGGDWMVVLEYAAEGHVPDGDVKSLDANSVLRRMQVETPQDRRRREQGLEVLRASHWVVAPHYDSARHQLAWAVEYETLSGGKVVRKGVNNTAVALGRTSRIVMNLVSDSNDAKATADILPALMAGMRFKLGHRYEDFSAAKDPQTSNGLAGLIAN